MKTYEIRYSQYTRDTNDFSPLSQEFLADDEMHAVNQLLDCYRMLTHCSIAAIEGIKVVR